MATRRSRSRSSTSSCGAACQIGIHLDDHPKHGGLEGRDGPAAAGEPHALQAHGGRLYRCEIAKDAVPDVQDEQVTQHRADVWIPARRSLALRVPSVVSAASYDHLLDPGHPEFDRATRREHLGPYRFDERLLDVFGAHGRCPRPTGEDLSTNGNLALYRRHLRRAPLTRPAQLTQNVGMSQRDADIVRHGSTTGAPASVAGDPVAALRDAGITSFFRPSQLAEAGLTRNQLPALLRSGRVEHVARGLYRIADTEPTENYSLAMACARVPNSVVCLLTALRVHEIGTQSPADVWLAIPHKARVPRLRELRLRTVRFSGSAWTFGVRETRFEGVPARITSPARTVADCFRFERLVGAEVAMEALHDALRQRKATIAELSRIADVLPSRRLSAALDVMAI